MCEHPDCVMGPGPHEQFTYWYEDERNANRDARLEFWDRLNRNALTPFESLLERAYQQGVADANS